MSIVVAIILNIVLFFIFNIWLVAMWALFISSLLVWFGYVVICTDTDIFN